MSGEYDRGDLVTISANGFTNDAGTFTDPTTVTARLLKPGGTVLTKVYGTDSEIIKDSTGRYHWDYIILGSDPTGIYYYQWAGTGTIQQTEQGYFTIRKSRF